MSTMGHKERLVAFLKREQGGMGFSNEQIKSFSEQVRALGLLDLSKTSTQEWVMTDKVGQGVLITLGTYHSLGFLSKWVELKNITEGK